MSPFHTICVEAYLILPEGVGLFCKYILNILPVNQLSLYWANHIYFWLIYCKAVALLTSICNHKV